MGLGGNNDGRGLEDASFRELRLLEEVGSSRDVSQRSLAGSLGIALGVVNVLVKSLVTKGHIRATRVSWKRWAYILTPAGLTRKVQLTAHYVDRFLGHYRRVRSLVEETLDTADIGPDSVVAVYGTTELAELMFLVLREAGVKRIEFVDDSTSAEFLGTPIIRLDSIEPDKYVKFLIAYASDVESRWQNLVDAGVSPGRITTLLDPWTSSQLPEDNQETATQ